MDKDRQVLDKKEEIKEEKIDTPTVTALKNFLRNKLAVAGLITFIFVFISVFVYSSVTRFDAYADQPILRNLQPGHGYLEFGQDVENAHIEKISSGISFSAALDDQGKIHLWGIDNNGVLTPSEEIQKQLDEDTFVDVAAGDRHIIALTNRGNLIGWGHNSFGQTTLDTVMEDVVSESYVSCPPSGCPEGLVEQSPESRLANEKISKIGAGDLFSAVLTEEGTFVVWGSTMSNKMDRVPEDLQGRIKDFDLSPNAAILLLDDNTIEVYGTTGNVQSRGIPDEVQDGSKEIVDIAVTFKNAFALDSEGQLYAWGPSNYAVMRLPEFNGKKITSIDGGREHMTALLEDGSVVSWGDNSYGQTAAPEVTNGESVSSDFFQNYVVDSEGKVQAWGNNGFVIGSDELGRDLFTRLMHGGRVSLTVGAIAVVISVILGVIVGMISGFNGGIIDNLLMRFAEIVGSFPLYPLIITLSAMLPIDFPPSSRMVMIMVIMGLITWPGIARLVRGQILQERSKDFVLAAKSLGIINRDIVIKHILPNVMNIIIVQITLGYASSLLSEAGLSFLGFGVPFPYPSWGNMLNDAQAASVIEAYWWRWVFPGLMVFITALSVNLVGDGLRDALDPKSNEK